MGKRDLSDIDHSAFSGLIDQSLKVLVKKQVAFERHSDRVISDGDAETFRKKMQHAWQLSLKDASHEGENIKQKKELTAAEKKEIKKNMEKVEKERKQLLKEVSALLDEVDTDSNDILEEQREKVKNLITELEGKSTLELSPMQGMELLSQQLKDLKSGPTGMLTLKSDDTKEDLATLNYKDDEALVSSKFRVYIIIAVVIMKLRIVQLTHLTLLLRLVWTISWFGS